MMNRFRNTAGYPTTYIPGKWGEVIYPGQYSPGWWGLEVHRTPTWPRPPWEKPWAPPPPSQRQIDIALRIAERRAMEQAQRQAEQARARERAAREAQERQREAERDRQLEKQARQTIERAQRQQREQQQRLRDIEQQRRLQEQIRRMQQATTQRGDTFLGDLLAGMVPPSFRYHALRRPILGAPFARTGIEALSNLKMREAFAGRFAFENLAFWSTQVAQVVGGVIAGLGVIGTIGQMTRQLGSLQTAVRLPPTSVVEIGAGDLEASRYLQRIGARVIAVEPDPTTFPARALREFEAMGGKWMGSGKTAQDMATKSTDHVVQYFP